MSRPRHLFSPFHGCIICLALLILLAALSGCRHTQAPAGGLVSEKLSPEQAAFDAFAEELFVSELKRDPIGCRYLLSAPEAFGIRLAELCLPSEDPSSRATGAALWEEYRERLAAFDPALLNEEAALLLRIFSRRIDEQLALAPYLLYDEPLSPYAGIHVQLPVLLAEYALRGRDDIDAYFGLLRSLPDYFSSIAAFEKEKASAGLFMSREALLVVRNACDSFAAPAEQHLLLASFEERILSLSDLTRAERALCMEENRRLVTETVLPCWRRLSEELSQLSGAAGDAQGIGRLPNGESFYELLAKSTTGTDYSREELLKILTDALEICRSRLQLLLLDEPELLSLLDDFHFLTQEPESIVAELRENLTEEYPEPPRAVCTVRQVPESLAPFTAPAFYLISPLDDPYQNTIYLNTAGAGLSGTRLYATLAHESWPGHLYQNIYFAGSSSYPLRQLLSCPGFSEGWATYAEHRVYEQAPSSDPVLARACRLESELNLLLSALADLLVGGFGQSLEQLGEFLRQFVSISEAGLDELYLYVCAEPCAYLKYAVGYLEFERLRSLCEQHIGTDFSPAEFHRVLLQTGEAPFPIVEEILAAHRLCPGTAAPARAARPTG